MLKKVAVFISGGGTNMEALIDKQEHYEVCLIISGKKDVLGLERAEKRGIPNFYIGKENYPEQKERTKKTLELLEAYSVDFIALAGYLSIVPPEIIEKYSEKIINIHPSLIPSFCGMGFHGEHVHKGVYEAGVKITGATVHFVNNTVDGGAIILQESVVLEDKDTPDIIGRKVLKIEHKIFPKALNLLAKGAIRVDNGRTYLQN